MTLYDEYVEYLKRLAPEAETWVQEQIAEELYTRDNSIKSLRARITELQEKTEPKEYINIKSHAALLERNKKVYRIIIEKQAAKTRRLREALWICAEHNALHFGETHNTVIQARAALAGKEGV